MKKVFNYLMVTALLLGVNVALVNAEEVSVTGSGNTDAEVTVGNVDTPVYDVNISWENFVFDWTYDAGNNQYNWVNHLNMSCSEITFGEVRDYNDFYGTYYSDATCKTVVELNNASNYQDSDVFYYHVGVGTVGANVYITDASSGGYITSTLTWNPENKYNFTTASFKYVKDTLTCVEIPKDAGVPEGEFYTNANCTGEKTPFSNLDNVTYYDWKSGEEEIPFNGNLNQEMAYNQIGDGTTNYRLTMELGVDRTKEITTPTAGDKIGTLTISIETH